MRRQITKQLVPLTTDSIKVAFQYAMNLDRVVPLVEGNAIVRDVCRLPSGAFLIEVEPIVQQPKPKV